jgi:tRNA (mo5U34)-methyltransferase
METTGAAQGGARDRFSVTEAERQVADLLPIEVDPALARATVETVPFWFHTFALNRAEGVYTPGAARDHRYRVSALPNDFGGLSVLDVGTFDGFYAFLAEHRGADRVVAVDNEQYRLWVASRWDVELEGGEGFRAIHRLLGSAVEYRRVDAFELDRLDERFDLVYCFGILHRVENPLGLLRVLRGRTASGGSVLVETYGVRPEDRDGPAIRVSEPGEVYARDEFVYWGFRAHRPRAACPDRRLLARRVAGRRGGRRSPAHHRPADRLERSRTAVSTASSPDGCSGVTAGRALGATVAAVPRRSTPTASAAPTALTRRPRRSAAHSGGHSTASRRTAA